MEDFCRDRLQLRNFVHPDKEVACESYQPATSCRSLFSGVYDENRPVNHGREFIGVLSPDATDSREVPVVRNALITLQT